ncbi:hypothetical protein A5724_20495 [Mycobacterium sp. ACS1612]|uniref:hypothetical protein n=1 Tax=Mycobacterium sp. ACS1612 TaxID=1834117 RepID=UPI0007FD0435|nr:hypothetical protein [Mycobacterium sp. ACS1612]OBF33006.1 hypothetical protein A5724_20495 [Mycobacterium sp. ACS1612]
MRKHFFRSFVADPVCASSDPGHHIDVGRYFMAVAKSAVTIPVKAHVRDGLVRLNTAETLWHHRPDDVSYALASTDGHAEWAPEWQVLLVPGAALADERTVFTLAHPDEYTDCAAELSLVRPGWHRC